MDPQRFAVLGIPARRLAPALLATLVVSVPSLLLIVLLVAMAIVWTGHGASVVLAVVAAVIAFLTATVFARCAMALGARALRARRSRELSTLALVVGVVVLVPIIVGLLSLDWRAGLPDAVHDAAGLLALTPLGAAWALPWSAGGLGAVVVSVLTLAAVLALWAWAVHRGLLARRPEPEGDRGGLGWFSVVPGTPAGAVAARSLIYWTRDTRHLGNIVIVPLLALLAIVPLVIVGVPLQVVALVPAPILALFLGWLPHNDVAYDSSAVWMHVAAAVRGTSDRVGRLVPILLIALPLLTVAVAVSVMVHGDPDVAAPLAGVCAGLFFSALGFSSIASAAAPYAVPRPGDGIFQQPQRTGGGASQALVLLGSLASAAPSVACAWLALGGDERFGMLALACGLLVGLAVMLVGIAVGAVVFQRRTSRIMEFAEAH